jgi:hypothetical protein
MHLILGNQERTLVHHLNCYDLDSWYNVKPPADETLVRVGLTDRIPSGLITTHAVHGLRWSSPAMPRQNTMPSSGSLSIIHLPGKVLSVGHAEHNMLPMDAASQTAVGWVADDAPVYGVVPATLKACELLVVAVPFVKYSRTRVTNTHIAVGLGVGVQGP